ncbi:hypothetical protein Tco_0422995, partial [Tanacetum coccineum]
SSKQGRSLIKDMDLDARISLVPLHVADLGRFDDTHVSDQPEEQLGVFYAAKTGSGLVSTAGMAGVSTASGLVSTAGMAGVSTVNGLVSTARMGQNQYSFTSSNKG